MGHIGLLPQGFQRIVVVRLLVILLNRQSVRVWRVAGRVPVQHDDTTSTILGTISENGIFLEWLSIVFIVLSCSCFGCSSDDITALVSLALGHEPLARCDHAPAESFQDNRQTLAGFQSRHALIDQPVCEPIE
jgi:hypothetical protein